MVNIKVEKKMNLAELIQYITENDIKNTSFCNQDNEDIMVWSNGKLCIYDHWNGDKNHINPKSLFTVEVEEEITEETVIPVLLEVCLNYEDTSVTAYTTRNECIAYNRDSHSLAFHRVNKDGTLTLLWTREGGIVE